MSVLLSSAALHEQLSIIMGALTKAVVVEICELVDEGYAALQREISRSHKENDDLRKKLHLIESIVVRGSGGGGPVQAAEAQGDTAAGDAMPPQTPRQQRDGDGSEAAGAAPSAGRDGRHAAVVPQELPDVVLIKDEDSDSNDTFDEGSKKPSDGGSAGSREVTPPFPNNWLKRMIWPEKEDAERKPSPDNPKIPKVPVGIQKKTVSVYSLDSPRSEPSCSGQLGGDVEVDAGESGCSYSSQMDSDVHVVEECSLIPSGSSRQVYFGSSALMESPSSRAELDLSVDQSWAKQSKGPMAFAQFHQSENVEGESFGVKLISVSGSTSTDCQLSEGSNSAFEYEDGEMMNYAMYGDQSGPSQPGARRKRFICSLCNKTYATAQNLDVHMRLHTGERPFSCNQCGKKFTQSAHLKSHLSVHSGERPYCCSVCCKSFIVKYSLKLHMKKCHANI